MLHPVIAGQKARLELGRSLKQAQVDTICRFADCSETRMAGQYQRIHSNRIHHFTAFITQMVVSESSSSEQPLNLRFRT
jgi:hypothetical protein